MFTSFFSWCTSLGGKLMEGDAVDFFRDYFEQSPVCRDLFVIALIVGAVVAALFYFGICNFVFQLAKRSIWFVTLAVVFIVTFLISVPTIVGTDGGNAVESTGLFAYAYDTEAKLLNNPSLSDEGQNRFKEIAKEYRAQFSQEDSYFMKDTLPLQMAAVNGGYAMIVFFLLSIGFKRFTRHGSAIPFNKK